MIVLMLLAAGYMAGLVYFLPDVSAWINPFTIAALLILGIVLPGSAARLMWGAIIAVIGLPYFMLCLVLYGLVSLVEKSTGRTLLRF